MTVLCHSIDIARLSVLVATASLASSLMAHPPHYHQLPPTGREAAQKRVPMRINQRPRLAPDDQNEPLEVGTVPEIDPARQVVLAIAVLDADTRQRLPHRVHIDSTCERMWHKNRPGIQDLIRSAHFVEVSKKIAPRVCCIGLCIACRMTLTREVS